MIKFIEKETKNKEDLEYFIKTLNEEISHVHLRNTIYGFMKHKKNIKKLYKKHSIEFCAQ